MTRKLALPFLCLAISALLCLSAMAQEFSAEIVNTHNGTEGTPSKIFVGKDKIRIESADLQRSHGAVIMNFSTQTMDVLMPERQMYFESLPGQMPGGRRMFRFFRPDDVNDACTEWAKMADHPKGTCRRVGTDTVNGRSAVKYEGTSEEGKTGYFWLDTKLKFPLKWQETDGGGELRNIQEGAQPESLFEIPAGYQKLDMGNMMGHMPQR
jgi:hypothetical protein